jgi:hypothetical protein
MMAIEETLGELCDALRGGKAVRINHHLEEDERRILMLALRVRMQRYGKKILFRTEENGDFLVWAQDMEDTKPL